MIYDSRAFTIAVWQKLHPVMCADAWEYKQIGNVIYARKHLSGQRNTTDPGWAGD